MTDDTKEALVAFALAFLHKALDEAPGRTVSLTQSELQAYMLEPGSTQLAFSLGPNGEVQISHIRLDDQRH